MQVKLEEDGLVRTVDVTYSLLRELPKTEGAEFKSVTNKTIRVPLQRLVLIVLVEEKEGNVYGPTPSNAKDRDSARRKSFATTKGCLPPSGAEGDYEKEDPGVLVEKTKVPKTTILGASVTYNQSVSLATTDMKDSVTKTYDAKRPDQLLLAY